MCNGIPPFTFCPRSARNWIWAPLLLIKKLLLPLLSASQIFVSCSKFDLEHLLENKGTRRRVWLHSQKWQLRFNDSKKIVAGFFFIFFKRKISLGLKYFQTFKTNCAIWSRSCLSVLSLIVSWANLSIWIWRMVFRWWLYNVGHYEVWLNHWLPYFL